MNAGRPGWCSEQGDSRQRRDGPGGSRPPHPAAPARTAFSPAGANGDAPRLTSTVVRRWCGALSRGLAGKARRPTESQVQGNKGPYQRETAGGRAGKGSCQRLLFHRKQLPGKPSPEC